MDKLSAAIVWADAHCVVADKPSGLLCVPGRGPEGADHLAGRVQADYADALIVHRLDMATSGLVVMARGAEMHRRLSRAFADRKVVKRYEAVVAGEMRPETCGDFDQDGWRAIDLPLAADWPNRPRQVVNHETGKPSRTRWRVLAYGKPAGTTRLELEPVTGRSHQLRVHLQAMGHPILGDRLYAPAIVQAMADRLLLHAAHLQLAHPETAETVRWQSPVPF